HTSLMQIATVITTQSVLHAVLSEVIASSVKEYVSIHDRRASLRISNYGSATMKQSSLSGLSSKEPDESFIYWRPGFKPRLQVAIACGVSENYKALCRFKDMWLQQMGAKAVVLISL
ncbi:hypothetical protein V1509DRAFT_547683, partial [Lipomyces kononenkoae]